MVMGPLLSVVVGVVDTGVAHRGEAVLRGGEGASEGGEVGGMVVVRQDEEGLEGEAPTDSGNT